MLIGKTSVVDCDPFNYLYENKSLRIKPLYFLSSIELILILMREITNHKTNRIMTNTDINNFKTLDVAACYRRYSSFYVFLFDNLHFYYN